MTGHFKVYLLYLNSHILTLFHGSSVSVLIRITNRCSSVTHHRKLYSQNIRDNTILTRLQSSTP